MKSGHSPSPAGGPEALPNARARRARRIPGARLRTAATLLVLAAVAVAFLLYDGESTFPTGAWIVAPSMPEWQQVPDAMPGHAFAQSADAFVTTWETISAGESIAIPVEVHSGETLTISWGDGSTDTTVTTSITVSHTYSTPDEYQVSMTGGLSRINLFDTGSTAGKLVSIDQWGDIEWATMDGAFRGASSMVYAATDVPDLSDVTSMRYMFFNVAAFDGDLSGWDVSNVENMVATFYGTSFNGDISGWDVSSVTTMDSMFYNAGSFNQDLSSWNTASVTDMSFMFGNAGSFNQDLSSWNTTSVTDMTYMFDGAAAFDGDISGWDVSDVTDMSFMFARTAAFDGDISGWDVSSVVNMEYMFSSAAAFDGDISGWDVSSVTNMRDMFSSAAAFNKDISSWNVSAVANMELMFSLAGSFDQNLGKWAVTLDNNSIDLSDPGVTIGTISPLAPALDTSVLRYGIGENHDSDKFEIVDKNLNVKANEDYTAKTAYTVNVTSATHIETREYYRLVDVTVTEGETNAAPVLDPIGSQSVDELDTLSFTATASDDDAGDTLTFTLGTGAPTGASITPGGAFSWTPDQSQDGDHFITVQVSDGRGGMDSQVVDVTVNNIAPLPVSARATSSAITLTLSEVVTSSGNPPNGFSVESGGDLVSVDSITGSGTKSLVLGLTGSISAPATLSYSGGDVADDDDRQLGSFSDLPVSFQSKKSRSVAPPAITTDSQGYPSSAIPEWAMQAAPEGPLQPVPADGTPYPLIIDQNGYALHSSPSTVIPTQVAAGQTVTIKVTIHDPTPIAYFAIYLNLQGNDISHLDSDAQIIWDSGEVRVTDPNGLMQDASVTLSEDPDDPAKKTATITVTFSDSMGETNMVIRTWNAAGQITEVKIFDALDVRAPEPEPAAVDPEPDAEPNSADLEPVAVPVTAPGVADSQPAAGPDADRDTLAIRMWSGFEPESISDAQLLASLGLDYPGVDIPSWVMTELGPLVAKDDITVEQFKTALEYVLEHVLEHS